MPRHPLVSGTVRQMQAGVFSRLAHRMASLKGEVYPLHVGDTWLDPVEGARMQDLRVEEIVGLHAYTRPLGHPVLCAAAARRWEVAPERVLVGAGATGGLSAVAAALLDPGDEVLILAPYWPLIPGIVRTARGQPVEVPFYDRPGDAEYLLSPLLSERTVALYLNSPNNPTGRVLGRQEQEEIAAFARRHDLWIWSDEVYEDFAYAKPHVPMRKLAPERTFTALSFSKAYGMAGNRCGVVLVPEDAGLLDEVRKASLHLFYAAPTASQLAAARALETGDAWLALAKEQYRQVGEAAAARLGLPAPEGGTFLFIDVSEHLDEPGEEGLHRFLLRCLDENLLLAPGSSCGEAYGGHVRLCFTSARPEVVLRGVERLARLMNR